MLGCRALQPKEVQLISSELSLRNRCIFILGIRTGFRIRELLSVCIRDVIDETGTVRNTLKVARKSMKGKASSRSMPLHDDAKAVISEYLKACPGLDSEPLFRSEFNGGETRGRIHHSVFRKQLKKAVSRASIRDGHLVSTHSLRKTFASNMNQAVDGNIFKLQKLMGHKSISSTAAYVSVNEFELFELVKKAK